MTRESAEIAFRNAMRNKSGRTPRQDDDRRRPFVGPLIRPSFSIPIGSTVFTMGSCFARNIEVYLDRIGFHVPMIKYKAPKEELYLETLGAPSIFNKYTPYSMLTEIGLAAGTIDARAVLVPFQGGYLDTQLHTDKVVSLERGLERRREIGALVRDSLQAARLAVITLGLVEAWYDQEAEQYLNETPSMALVKAHPGRFSFEKLKPAEVFAATEDLIEALRRHGHPEQRVLLTVSPVPLGRTFTAEDVMVANCYSKSVLRTAAEIVVDAHDHVDYYPSFESVTLSDRSGVWHEDGVHVLNGIVEFNVNRMIDAYVEREPVAQEA